MGDESTEQVETSTAQSSGQGGNPSENWQERYNGLMRAFTKAQTDHKTAIDALNAKLVDLTAQLETERASRTTSETNVAQANTQVQDLTNKSQDLEGKLNAANAEIANLTLILTEFPALGKFRKMINLPANATPEEMRTQLTEFSNLLKTEVGSQALERLAGASPDTAGDRGTPSQDENEDYIWGQMMQYAGRDSAKYAEWQQKWDAVQEKKSSRKS